MVYGIVYTSSKSLIPQISRPSMSRQVPKFSRCKSPTAKMEGALAASPTTSRQICNQR